MHRCTVPTAGSLQTRADQSLVNFIWLPLVQTLLGYDLYVIPLWLRLLEPHLRSDTRRCRAARAEGTHPHTRLAEVAGDRSAIFGPRFQTVQLLPAAPQSAQLLFASLPSSSLRRFLFSSSFAMFATSWFAVALISVADRNMPLQYIHPQCQ